MTLKLTICKKKNSLLKYLKQNLIILNCSKVLGLIATIVNIYICLLLIFLVIFNILIIYRSN
jgi:hypothetical protein